MNRNVSIRRKQEGQAHAVQEPPAAPDRRVGVIPDLEHTQGAAIPTLLQHPVPGLQTPVVMTAWKLIYNAFDAAQERLRETLCTLGNGYFATRGAAEEAVADDVHYPGTYLAGGYNRLETEMAGQVIENEDFVNLPNWLCLTFRLEHGEWFDLKAVDVLSYCQELHLKHGVLSRTLRFRDLQGRETTLASRRLVHMGDRHLAATAITLTAENWSGRMQVRSALDGRIINAGVPRYQQLHSKHLMPLQTCQVSEDSILLLVQTNQSHLRVAEVARTQVFGDGAPLVVARRTIEEPGYIAQEFDLDLAQGASVTLEKSVALYTSRDHTMAECSLEARQAVRFAGRFDALLPSHIRAWERLWSQCDLVLDGSQRIQHMLRLHIFHLLQTVSRHTIDLDVGMPARGLHGEAYRGHVFWDELFVFPFLNLHLPEISRALLLYRYRRLPQARWSAREAGYCGAMYPWQSGSNGREENQVIHLNPRSGHWVQDNTHLQRHVNAAIAYNIWQYYQATADVEFLSLYGAEMLLEIARFLASTTTYNADLGCYEIHGVMGSDEYHDQYPDANEPGLNNNAYTNIMTVWTLQRAREVLQLLAPDHRQALRDDLDLSDAELERWEDISRKMRIVFHGDGIISQFEGYDTLEEFDWHGYHQRYGNLQRLDRILEAEGDTPNRYKLSKQADVLMLFYLFSLDELRALFQRLGYVFDCNMLTKNVAYYAQRTAHGSSLSRIVHAWALAPSDPHHSWELFHEALEVDVSDIQGGTTEEGIHLGAIVGTVDLLQRCYTGLEIRDDVLWLNPRLPDKHLKSFAFSIRYRGRWLTIEVTHERLKVLFRGGWEKTAKIVCRGDESVLEPGDAAEFLL